MVEEVRKLKAQPGKNIYVDGSSVLIHTLAQHTLVDEYSLLVYPLVLGGGKRIFPEGLRVDLKLLENKIFSNGRGFAALCSEPRVGSPVRDLDKATLRAALWSTVTHCNPALKLRAYRNQKENRSFRRGVSLWPPAVPYTAGGHKDTPLTERAWKTPHWPTFHKQPATLRVQST